jgi:hypothetical protein
MAQSGIAGFTFYDPLIAVTGMQIQCVPRTGQRERSP